MMINVYRCFVAVSAKSYCTPEISILIYQTRPQLEFLFSPAIRSLEPLKFVAVLLLISDSLVQLELDDLENDQPVLHQLVPMAKPWPREHHHLRELYCWDFIHLLVFPSQVATKPKLPLLLLALVNELGPCRRSLLKQGFDLLFLVAQCLHHLLAPI